MLHRPRQVDLHLRRDLTNRVQGIMESPQHARERPLVAQSSVQMLRSVCNKQIDVNERLRKQVDWSDTRKQQAQANLAAPVEAGRPKLKLISKKWGRLCRQEMPLDAAGGQTLCQEKDVLGRALARTLQTQRAGRTSI